MIFEGLLSFSLWGYIAIAFVLTHITIASVTIYLHRHQTHRALDLHPSISQFFRFWLWLTTGMNTREWVSIHRKHHAKCETDEDPHSPKKYGIMRVLFGGVFLYHKESLNKKTIEAYGRGTPDDWIERRLYTPYAYLGVLLMGLIDLLVFGLAGVAIFAVQMVWIPFWAAGVINGVGHYGGYRNYEIKDASTNIVPWGILIGGEELHNNHHAYPASARLSNKWWEFDIGWIYIRTLEMLGLAKVRRVAPRVDSIVEKQRVDENTIHAILLGRSQLLKIYSKKVIKPVYRMIKVDANRRQRKALRLALSLMIREDKSGLTVMDSVAKVQHSAFNTVYAFKQQLKAIGGKAARERVAALQAWCSEAEQSGIKALQNFSVYLRGYTVISA